MGLSRTLRGMESFAQTTRALERDRARGMRSWTLTTGSVLLLIWGAWFVLGNVPVTATSSTGRLRTVAPAHPLAVGSHAGTVVESRLALGAVVDAGEVLVELEAHGIDARVDAEAARLRSLLGERAAVTEELAALDSARVATSRAFGAWLDQARAQLEVARVDLEVAERELERQRRLHDRELGSAEQLRSAEDARSRARSEVEARRAGLAALESDRDRQLLAIVDGRTEARAEQSHLDGDIEIARRGIEHYEEEREHYEVSATVSGVVGSVIDLTPGTFLAAGQVVGTVVPDDSLLVVATFRPTGTAGRIRPGQPARLVLDAYAWPAHGAVPLVVAAVASEPDARGLVRVELRLGGAGATPLRHGATGSVEVEVGRESPWKRLAATLGRSIGSGETERATGETSVDPTADDLRRGFAAPDLSFSDESGLAAFDDPARGSGARREDR